jgi:hypothetical protein
VTGFGLGWFMVFNATFNNISVISWQPILLVEETGENLYHIMLYQVHLTMNRVRTHNGGRQIVLINVN